MLRHTDLTTTETAPPVSYGFASYIETTRREN